MHYMGTWPTPLGRGEERSLPAAKRGRGLVDYLPASAPQQDLLATRAPGQITQDSVEHHLKITDQISMINSGERAPLSL